MLDQLKKIVRSTEEADVPTKFMFGAVTSLSPLTVLVDNRFYISPPALKVMKEIYGHSHVIPSHSTQTAAQHSHDVSKFDSDIAEALAVGDEVVLLRNRGGQQYLIIGRGQEI